VEELAERLLSGDRRALARVISLVEDDSPRGHEALRLLYGRTGRAHAVGITGSSGSGKSTLVGALAREYRSRGRTVGIIAVDPSSPFSHGALLGDRIRMQELSSDPAVFVRSMATRGALGGLAATTAQVASVLDAAGKDVVFIETVGAGQDEVAVAGAALTTVVVMTPGMGDEVQAMKAGIMEIADILDVNKADLPGADALVSQLSVLIAAVPGSREAPIVKTVATGEQGIGELADAIDAHRRYMKESGELAHRRLAEARQQVLAAARHRLLAGLLEATERDGRLDGLVKAVAERTMDPHTAAEQLIEAASRQQ
jgi:LAO/AO transport system kinase